MLFAFYLSFVSLQHHGSVRKMNSHVRMATVSAAYGTVMATMTVGTTVMNNVVSSLIVGLKWCLTKFHIPSIVGQ